MKKEKIIYSKYSNERIEKYRIRTDILKNSSGKKIVKKYPMHPKAAEHISRIYDYSQILQKKYKRLPIVFNACKKEEDCVSLEYIEGISLDKQLEKMIFQGETEKAQEIIDEVVSIIKKMGNRRFKETEEFRQVFGHCDPGIWKWAICGCDIDIIFSNIIINEKGWNIIDYEWFYNFPIPVNFILYRLLYTQAPKVIKEMNLCEKYGIKEDEKEVFIQMESAFYKNVYSDNTILTLSPIIKQKYVIDQNMIEKNTKESSMKVYYDYGQGLSEENTDYFFYHSKENIVLDIPLGSNIKAVRIDPMDEAGIVHIKKLTGRTEKEEYGLLSQESMQVNGNLIQEGYYLFDTEDPWIYLSAFKIKTNQIHVEIGMECISQQTVRECLISGLSYRWEMPKSEEYE